MSAILTLLTDFGTADGYAGALQGAIARVDPRLRVVTITHGVPPHDIGAGAYWLAASAPAFPPGTVHCVVVDPGVGTDRPLVAARVDRQLVVAPDNGLLHFLWSRGQDRTAVRVDTSGLDPRRISSTFHGRDVIGPLAARLALGSARFEDLGAKIPSPQLVSEFLPQGDSAGTTARVLVVDRFGNVILTVARTPWYAPLPASVSLSDGRVISSLVRTYGEIEGGFAMLWNSAEHLEIAGKGISASALLNLQPGDRVRVAWGAANELGPASETDRRSFAS
ncbi:MAG: SAM hydrolase/SAM-dependent halogenase family protein [Candidatus Dormibacteria bacterium]